jgi:hypothetical protein
MLIGEPLQDKLNMILLRWRMHKYVFTVDVEIMYRQIEIAYEDRKYQKNEWRYDKNTPIK